MSYNVVVDDDDADDDDDNNSRQSGKKDVIVWSVNSVSTAKPRHLLDYRLEIMMSIPILGSSRLEIRMSFSTAKPRHLCGSNDVHSHLRELSSGNKNVKTSGNDVLSHLGEISRLEIRMSFSTAKPRHLLDYRPEIMMSIPISENSRLEIRMSSSGNNDVQSPWRALVWK
eukprot:279945-Amphidinium_carterae.1